MLKNCNFLVSGRGSKENFSNVLLLGDLKMALGRGLTRGKVSLWVSPPSPPLPTYDLTLLVYQITAL